MTYSIAQRLRVAILPFAAIAVVACGGGAAVTQGTDGSTGTDDPGAAATSGEDGAASSLAPAGARSYFTFDPSGGGLVRVDPDNGQVDEVLDLEGSAFTMAQGEDALWLGMDSGAVLRVDPAAGSTIAEIAAPGTDTPFDLSVGNGAAWALYGVPGLGGSLVRIDPATNTGGEPITPAEGLSFFDVDAGDEGTWLVGSSPEMATTLYAVDATTGDLTDQKVQMVIDSIASGEGAVWLGGTIFPDGAVGVPGIGRFDPASGELTTTELPGEAGSIAVGSGGVWAVAGLGADGTTLYRIDPATGALNATIPLGEAESGYVKVSTGAGAVWVNTAGGASYVVDPADNTVAGEADSMGTLGLFFR
jgi:hypothetical protein